MTQIEFNQSTDELTRHADAIIDAKRCDYTEQNVDVLHNFKASAVAAGIAPLQAWLVHWHKQSSAVSRFIKNPSIPPSEPMLSRFADLRNYLQLGYALMVERLTSEKVNYDGGKAAVERDLVGEVFKKHTNLISPDLLTPDMLNGVYDDLCSQPPATILLSKEAIAKLNAEIALRKFLSNTSKFTVEDKLEIALKERARQDRVIARLECEEVGAAKLNNETFHVVENKGWDQNDEDV